MEIGIEWAGRPFDPEAARARAAQLFDGPIELARDGALFSLGR